MEPLRSAAGFEGLVVLAVIYGILSLLSKAGRKAGTSRTPAPAPARPDEDTPVQGEAVSLESILRQIETVKRQKQQGGAGRPVPSMKPKPAPPRMREVIQDARGPLGRISRTGLESAEDVEDRTSLEEEGRLVEERRLQNVEIFTERPQRVVDNRDEEAEAIAQRRIKAAEARNRPHAAADHQQFDQAIRAQAPVVAGRQRLTAQGLREALVWREILGPPRSMQDE